MLMEAKAPIMSVSITRKAIIYSFKRSSIERQLQRIHITIKKFVSKIKGKDIESIPT